MPFLVAPYVEFASRPHVIFTPASVRGSPSQAGVNELFTFVALAGSRPDGAYGLCRGRTPLDRARERLAEAAATDDVPVGNMRFVEPHRSAGSVPPSDPHVELARVASHRDVVAKHVIVDIASSSPSTAMPST